MEKQKRWQLILILIVLLLTLYNILPTIFYYSKPLKQPIDAKRGEKVALEIAVRTNALEKESKEWLFSFCKLLKIEPLSISLRENDPRFFDLTFKAPQEAQLFSRFLPQAGALIPFVPAQLELLEEANGPRDGNKVTLLRKVGLHIASQELSRFFHFSFKEEKGQIVPLYLAIVEDRASQLMLGFAATSYPARQLTAVVENGDDPRYQELTIEAARNIVEMKKIAASDEALLKRYYANYTQQEGIEKSELIQKFATRMEALKNSLDKERKLLVQEQNQLKEKELSLEPAKVQQLALLDSQFNSLESAIQIVKSSPSAFQSKTKPLTEQEIKALFANSRAAMEATKSSQQKINLAGYHPFIESLTIDWRNDEITLVLYEDLQAFLSKETMSEVDTYLKERLNQYVINEIARIARFSDETIIPNALSSAGFVIALNKLTASSSLLAFDLGYVAQRQAKQIQQQLENFWLPKGSDLHRDAYPIRDYGSYLTESNAAKRFGLVVYAPAARQGVVHEGFRSNAIYIIAKDLDAIIQKYQSLPKESEERQLFIEDFKALQTLLQHNGFIGYPGSSYGLSSEFAKDYIFELSDYYGNLLKATRENFHVAGSKRYAILEFTTVEQRLLAKNKIDDRIQEDLLKWKEEYNAAQIDLNATSRYTVPAPTKNVFWENFKLSAIKYFRGDDRKILKWGLDLSGGKTVRIALRDQNNRTITNPDDIRQAVNELYLRINKMGVSERTIRVEGETILLDFPGSQDLSASELVKASAMYFHVVNEKFSPGNALLAEAVSKFLQEVWNEAVITNRKDAESINEIAWRHLGGDIGDSQDLRPRSEYATLLYDNGLRLANPKEQTSSPLFNDQFSTIGIYRGEDFSEWYGQTHPLAIIFYNYALAGSSLENIQVGYDSSEGNILMFSVKSSYASKEKGSGSPRDDFYTWTSQFSEEKIAGTPKESYTHKHGWRMAVILNGQIISAPTLRAALRDHASISGRFSQREINQLAADLKAGSLSFTPKILSEENVSPELGHEERTKGIVAAVVALMLVVTAMVGYYHFAGLVATAAVFFNLLIMWGVLQNLGAALTLPGIAGIVLTIGMAVDANVLVFERIREEFKATGRIALAIQAGYRKAFSAIIDSNITTIIAALILIQFDSGPIKGFAVTLIIGIISSMFTALFMTRYFFAGWVKNPAHKSLSMSQFIGQVHFDFLGQAKKAWLISCLIMVIGTYFLMTQRKTILGMDFTGGYSVTVELQEKNFDKEKNASYRLQTINALLAQSASSNDVQVRELSRPNQLRIQLSMGMEQPGHPFYHMPEELLEGNFTYDYQRNPRLVWLVNALQKAHLQLPPEELSTLANSWMVMSGQLSDTMRNNAIIALTIALLAILLYITFRFEFKFAIGAVVGLAHDVIITLGILALFHRLGAPVQIDLQVIGAIMTIIGYSLNDTIIVFDRIREDIRLLRKMAFKDIVNHALNITLSRTLMTSGTTLLVLLTLVCLGGHSIFAFSLVMTLGVIVGTLSSLFIAAPVMLYFHDREEKQQAQLALKNEVN